MKKYELVIILDASMPQSEKETIVKQAADLVQKNGGQVINSQVWLEKQKFTFRIKKCAEGTYYIVNFESAGGVISKLRENLKINERILRFVVLEAY